MRRVRHIVILFVTALIAHASTAPANLQLPAFPLPVLVRDGGPPKEFSSNRLLRELHRGGVHNSESFEAFDNDYALLRGDSLGTLAAWLESACQTVGYDLLHARTQAYDGAVFARLLSVATSLAALRERGINLAMPIGVLICQRARAWGELPADGSTDAYVLFATDTGILVYDPPTRQLTGLADFPNKASISRIRF
jgi:hypothetical protein